MIQNVSTQNLNHGEGKTWEKINPLNTDHDAIAAKIGKKIARTIQGTNINFPGGMSKDPDDPTKFWVAQYSNRLVQVDTDYNITSLPNIQYQAPANGDGIAYTLDVSVYTDRIILPSYGHHCVKVYDRTNNDALISTIGVPAGVGNHSEGRLRNPYSAILLPNGNVLVSCYNSGPDATTPTNGSLSEWDISTPVATLVAVHMDTSGGTTTAVGSRNLYRPMDMIVDKDDSNILWVSAYTRGEVLKINMTTWLTEAIFTQPTGGGVITNSYGLTQMADGTIVVAANGGKMIVGLNPTDGSPVFELDPSDYGISAGTMRGVHEIEEGYIGVSDWSNQAIYVVYPQDVVIPYEEPTIPHGWSVDESNLPDEMDTATWTRAIKPGNIVDESGELVVIQTI